MYPEALVGLFHGADGRIEMEIDMILHPVKQILEHDVIFICAEVADGRVKQKQLVLHTQLLDCGIRSGIQLGPLSAESEIDLVHVTHQVERLALADVLMQRTAELVGDVVFAVGKRTGTTETVHDCAGTAPDTRLDLLAVNGTFALLQRIARLKHADLQIGTELLQFKRGKNPSGTRSDDNDIIFHSQTCLPGSMGTFSISGNP